MVQNPVVALEMIISLGFERVLTSGLDSSVLEGLPVIKRLVEQVWPCISVHTFVLHFKTQWWWTVMISASHQHSIGQNSCIWHGSHQEDQFCMMAIARLSQTHWKVSKKIKIEFRFQSNSSENSVWFSMYFIFQPQKTVVVERGLNSALLFFSRPKEE